MKQMFHYIFAVMRLNRSFNDFIFFCCFPMADNWRDIAEGNIILIYNKKAKIAVNADFN